MSIFTKRNTRQSLRVVLPVVLAMFLCGNAFSQTTWEFDGMPYAYQKAHFDSATNIVRTKLGIQMRTFGAPYNQIDTTFRRVMSEDTSYKVLLLGQVNPFPATGAINLTRRVQIENGTGIPDFAYFLADYNAKKPLYTDYMVMQGHPYAWTTPAKQTAFQNIVNHMIADSVVFNTPYGYYRYLTDLSIPRTNKVQVLLKLDDLRATSTFFAPCFPAFNFLVANKVKAGIGVNWMWNLTQVQIDTLNYYLAQTDTSGTPLFEIWNHGLDHSMNQGSAGGSWSAPGTWPSGTVPTASDDVIIPAGVTVTIDVTDAECQNLTINGTLEASNTTTTNLAVNGDVVINSGGSFTSPYLSTGTSNIIHTLQVYGDFINSGGTFDFRTGSAGTTMRVMNTSFLGSSNSTINVGTYSSSNNDFNSITIDKSSGARVICASDVFIDQGASTCRSQLTMANGIIETGNHAIHVLSLTSTDLITPSATSYVLGALGRGMSNSGGKSCLFPVGDAGGYRPLTVISTTAGIASGHYVVVRCIPSDANTGGSTLAGGIDAVTRVRYYRIGYSKGIGAGADSMKFDRFYPTYGTDDGVAAGNNDLRVAYSVDSRATWNGLTQVSYPHTTTLTNPPTQIKPDSLIAPIVLNNNGNLAYIALANTIGGANPLGRPGPTFVVGSATIDFGSVAVSTTALDSVTVSNGGSFPLDVASVTSDNPRFGVTPASATIPMGGSAKFHVTFSPTANGAQSGNITFVHNAPGSPSSVAVSGLGVSAIFTPTPAALSFPDIDVGSTVQDSLSVKNNGNISLHITSISTDNPAQFTVTETGPVSVAANDSVTIHVAFHPTTSGAQTGNIVFNDDGVSMLNTHTVALSGTGLSSTVSVNVAITADWNMIANPVTTVYDSVRQLYPTASFPHAYQFTNGYAQTYRMVNGAGYWVKFPAPTTQAVNGSLRTEDSISVVAGWNMVGTISNTVDTGAVVSVPAGLRASNWFGYSNGYFTATQLVPGKAYWVKANAAGKFLLTTPNTGAKILKGKSDDPAVAPVESVPHR